ncbi:helix-turn-helix domain-containing protein [Agriterribacter sp.]|uniref:helix-turn-helix domain-containing protein n=1 Tax=Agriterribacter sp. TaxID=2821509 RepID=UPI002C2EFEB3|nr:helix-turn-helix domain-containing protein [Agriterribacter sp.]HRP57957.1 helix-turn-helix domain-containing protein [Agriterribacter sp.]
MVLHHYRPLPELRFFISRIMLVHYQLDTSKPRPVNPFPPQPDHCLYFYPYDKMSSFNYATRLTGVAPRSMLIGPQLSRVDLTMGYNQLTIMVSFQPGGMHRLLNIPMKEMTDQPFDAALFLGNDIDSISQRLGETADYDLMIDIIQSYLLGKVSMLKSILPVEQVLMQNIQNGDLNNIDRLAKQSCVSTRQLERQFLERIGMPPKFFARLVRFSKAWYMRESNEDISWLSIAHSCGYADQMHMIRDFKAFSGVTPTGLQSYLEKSPLRLQRDSGFPA